MWQVTGKIGTRRYEAPTKEGAEALYREDCQRFANQECPIQMSGLEMIAWHNGTHPWQRKDG
jgi:hypothetical protein